MNRSNIKRTVERAFAELHTLSYRGNRNVIDQILTAEKEDERAHRKWGDGLNLTAADSVTLCAKYFTLTHLASAWNSLQRKDLRPRDILHCKRGFVLGAALADAYPDETREALEKIQKIFDDAGISWEHMDYGEAKLSISDREMRSPIQVGRCAA